MRARKDGRRSGGPALSFFLFLSMFFARSSSSSFFLWKWRWKGEGTNKRRTRLRRRQRNKNRFFLSKCGIRIERSGERRRRRRRMADETDGRTSSRRWNGGGKRAMTMRDVEGTGELVIVSPTYLLCLLFLFLCLSAVEEIHPPPSLHSPLTASKTTDDDDSISVLGDDCRSLVLSESHQ